MNAYELADELQKHGLNGDNYGLFNKRIQNMLRKQADRIAELEKQSEPVAWMAEHFDGRKRVEIAGNVYDQDVGWGHKRIPLYITPQTLKPDASQNQGEEQMNDGYYCVVCGKYLPADEYGVIVHDDIKHPTDMTFDDEEKPQ